MSARIWLKVNWLRCWVDFIGYSLKNFSKVVLALFLSSISFTSIATIDVNSNNKAKVIHIENITPEMMENDEGLQIAVSMMNSLESSIYRANSKVELVTNFMQKYFTELYEVDVLIAEEMVNEDDEKTKFLLEQKKDIFKKYWLLDDEQRAYYYEPMSYSSIPEHDWAKVKNIKIFETGDDIKPQFLFAYSYESFTGTMMDYVFSVVYFDGKLKIIDYYFGI